MPGIIGAHGPDEFYRLIGQLQASVRALQTQQQATYTDSQGRAIINVGLVPGSNPARFGLQFLDPATGAEIGFIGENTASGQALSLTMTGNNSAVTVKDATNGGTTGVIGALPAAFNRTGGSAQPGVVFYREDGSTAMFLGDLNPTTPPYKQSLQLMDRIGNVYSADDTNSGFGIARPHLALPLPTDTNTARWPGTSNAAWTDVCDCYAEIQQPKLSWIAQIYAPASVTGSFRLKVNGTQIGTTATVTNGFATWSDTQAIPAGITFGTVVPIEVDAAVTAGTGTVLVRFQLLEGTQT